MSARLDNQYFEWLYNQVASAAGSGSSKRFWKLFRQLYSKEFVWIVPNDDNRVEDGRDLRREFIEKKHIRRVDEVWLYLPCSFLELLIGLSRRLAFETDNDPRDWFWQLLENLNLDKCSDELYSGDTEEYVNTILDDVIWRTYDRNGIGGLFPLRHSNRDQRDVELWYQLSAYLLEHEM